MQKTRLGISTGIMGAAVFFLGLFGGYLPALLLTMYILMFETDEWLKQTAFKAIAFMMICSVLITLLNLIPDFMDIVYQLAGVSGLNSFGSRLDSLFGALTGAVDLVRKIFMLLFGFKALRQETVPVRSLDELVEKHMK